MAAKPFGRNLAAGWMAVCLTLWVPAAWLAAQSGEAYPAAGPADSLTVSSGTPVVLRLTGDLSGEDGSASPQIVAAQDVVLDGLTVIAAGAPARYSRAGRRPGSLVWPGKIGFEIASITMTSGHSIRLSASHSVYGAQPCVDYGCAARPLFFWLKGDPGTMQGGLLVNATIAETVVMPRKLFAAPPEQRSSSFARIHLYHLAEAPGGVGPRISLDGHVLGILADDMYACVAVRPGSHMLRIGEDTLALDAEAGGRHYVRIRTAPGDPDSGIIEETDGYRYETDILTPGSFGSMGTACFGPQDDPGGRAEGRKKSGFGKLLRSLIVPRTPTRNH